MSIKLYHFPFVFLAFLHADFKGTAKSERIVRNGKIFAFLGSLNLWGGGRGTGIHGKNASES
jgi:hypothetical protein